LIARSAALRRRIPVAVEADEAAGSLAEIYELVSGEIVDAVSLKVPKLGGLRNTLAAARLCEAAGVPTVSVPRSAAGSCELGEFDRLLDDPFEGLEVERGVLKLPPGPGSGVRRRESN
jgi:L-Ala-D/L-Glu epimerase